VSGGSQDIKSQNRSIDAHTDAHGYADTGKAYELPAVSAMKGEHVAELERVINDAQAGLFDVLVISDSSRIERRGEDELYVFLARMRAAGARVESASEPMFGTDGLAGKIMTIFTGAGDHAYVVKVLKSTGRGVVECAERGDFIGSEPWGFVSAGVARHHFLEPMGYARDYLPGILKAVATGESLGDVAAWLTAEQVPTGRGRRGKVAPWHAATVAHVVRNTAAVGRVTCARTVKDKDFNDVPLAWVHEFEAVADDALWRAANAELNRRRAKWKAGERSGRKHVEPLSGTTYCDQCLKAGRLSPMYRLASGKMRCTGRGAQRKGCGAPMIPVAVAQKLGDAVFACMTGDDYEIHEVRTVPGNAGVIAAELAKVAAREQQINASGKTFRERQVLIAAEIAPAYERVEAIEPIPDEERRVPTGECIADVYADESRRASLLKSGEFLVTFGRADGTEDHAIDGWGIWVGYPEDEDVLVETTGVSYPQYEETAAA
jgi:hypothetical protein